MSDESPILAMIETDHGKIPFTGHFDHNAVEIFSFEYCANFAKVLSKYTGFLPGYVPDGMGSVLHWFCYDPINHKFYDICGKFTYKTFTTHINQIFGLGTTDGNFCIGLGEEWDTTITDEVVSKDDYLAEAIIQEYASNFLSI